MRKTSPDLADARRPGLELLRALHRPEYLGAKAGDVGAFAVWATVVTGFFVATTPIWDFAIDPVHWRAALPLRMTESAAVLLLALVMRHSPTGVATRIGLFLVPFWVQLSFIDILARLDGGPSYGIGGFLYFFVFVPFMAQAQSLRFSAGLLASIALFPNLVALSGHAPHLDLGVYNAYVWMVYPPVVMILGLVEYLLFRIAQARHRLAREAATDPLTGVSNRRHFLAIAPRLMHLAERSSEPVSLLFLDVDHFKRINDEHGHAVGDQVLQTLAQLTRELVRRSDLLARYGGEEFVILLPGAGAAAAARFAERLRRKVAAVDHWAETDRPLSVTASIGVASAEAGAAGLRALLKDADAALYEAKRGGRNQVAAAHSRTA